MEGCTISLTSNIKSKKVSKASGFDILYPQLRSHSGGEVPHLNSYLETE